MNRQLDSGKSVDEGVGSEITHTLQNILRRVAEWFMWLGGGLLVVVTLLTVSDSFGRYFLNSPIVGNIEIVPLLLVVIAFTGMVYVAAKERNVKVDIVVSHFPGIVQRILVFIMTLISAGVLALVSWQLWLAAEKAVRTNQHSPALDIPYAPFKFTAAVAAGLICLLLLIGLINSLVKRRQISG